jgi:flagellar protein FlaI
MRPDRIILGEMRMKQEAEVLFEAMHTGHSVYATVHADTVAETITRMVNPPISTPANLLSAVHLNVVQFRDRRKGIRRTYQVGEFVTTETDKGIDVKANILYRWKASVDEIVPHAESVRFFEELSRHTGFNTDEIDKDIKRRVKILEYMMRHNVHTVDQVGTIMNHYYLNFNELVSIIDADKDASEIYNLPNPFRTQ